MEESVESEEEMSDKMEESVKSKEEMSSDSDDDSLPPKPKEITFSVIAVDDFGDYVAQCHSDNNKDFMNQFSVSNSCIESLCRCKDIMIQELDKDIQFPISIGMSLNCKPLNRFKGITVCEFISYIVLKQTSFYIFHI